MNNQVFINEIKATFRLRNPKSIKPTNIYLCVFIDKKQLKFSTGVKVYPEHWNKSKYESYVSVRLSELDNVNNTIVNNKLVELKSSFNDYKNYLCAYPEKIDNAIEILKTYIYKDQMTTIKKETLDVFAYLFDCLDKDVNKKGDILATGSNRSTKAIDYSQIKPFKTYIKSEQIEFYSFNDITRDIIYNYQQWLITNLKGRSNDGKCSVSTINKNINKLLELINKYAVKRGKMDNTHFLNLQIEKLKDKSASIDNYIALRDDEIHKLWNYKALSKADEHVKDIFILNCLIGQRIGDVDKIDKSIERTENSTYISIVQDKCTHKIETEIIFTLAKTILEKYDYKLPNVNKGTFNTKLKAIAKQAGITGTETITTHTAGCSEPITEYKERYDCISSHTARRTFVTLLSLRGWNYSTIAKYTGHTVEMVELYDKSKGNTKSLRQFKELEKNYPELVLKMIDDDNEVIETNDSNIESMLKQILELHKPKDTKTKVDDNHNIQFDTLFCKRWTNLALKQQLQSLKGYKQTDKVKETYTNIINTIYKDARFADTTINDAIVNYKPKADDYHKLRTLLVSWIELNINDEVIYKYLERAKQVGINTTGLKEYIEETRSFRHNA